MSDKKCEELIEAHQASRLSQILPDFETLQQCFDYFTDYSNADAESFYKEVTGEKALVDEWVEAEKITDPRVLRADARTLDSDFDAWVWENYEQIIKDFMSEFHQERLAELPLAISRGIQYRIELSWGGPQDYLLLDYDPEGRCWTGGAYHYLDWFDGARRPFGHELADRIANAFGIDGGE